MAPRGKRVALTGATGFVGGHTLDHLLGQGYSVSALTRRAMPARDGVTWVEGDLTRDRALAALVEGADAVIHVAGLIKARRDGEFFDVNVGGTGRLIAALAGRPVKFVHLSSLAARERHLSAYAASKAAAEDLLAQTTGLDWTILRPPAVYGPGDRETLVFFKAAATRRPLLPGSPRHRSSLIHVHDLASALEAALRLPGLSGKTADVHDSRDGGYALADVLALIAGRTGWHRPLFLPPAVLGSVGGMVRIASMLTGGVPMLTPGKARELSFPDWVCRDRTLEACGWRASIDAERGLRDTRVWYEASGDLP